METKEWGPILWKILHTLAEKTTESHVELWKLLINNMPNIIMCDYCQLHVEHYTKKYPFENEFIRDYLYHFHEYVNKQTNKPSFDYNLLTNTYQKTENLEELIHKFYSLLDNAIELNLLQKLKCEHWLNIFQQLVICYHF